MSLYQLSVESGRSRRSLYCLIITSRRPAEKDESPETTIPTSTDSSTPAPTAGGGSDDDRDEVLSWRDPIGFLAILLTSLVFVTLFIFSVGDLG